ncbi:sensor histidine kinase [Streptosporangium sp. NPDC050855]|uniref:sensor histidine kinase n=1 Tax=Streptosporangium sp. NPDC050855 TaxID=3366194 RepID=UPI003796E580
MRRYWSLRTRMAVWCGAVMALVCGGFCALTLTNAHHHVTEDRTGRILATQLRVAPLIPADRRLPAVLPGAGMPILQVVDPRGRVVSASRELAGRARIASFLPPEDSRYADRTVCDAPGLAGTCMILVALRVPEAGGEWIVYGADHAVPWYTDLRLLAALLAGSALLTGLSASGAYRAVASSLDPVEAICAELAEITATDLGRRVPVPASPDEIQKLARTVNQTLDRLEAAVERERRFAADASHDLRSPITAMRVQVEEALLHPRETDWPAVSAALLADLHRLQAIVTDLLTLARLDADLGGADGTGDGTDLGELVASELTHRGHRTRITADLAPGLTVTGDRLQLTRLLGNLLDNAERHAAHAVTVSVRGEGSDALLEVSDDGPGIPADQREVVFQRFTRLDSARSKDEGGTGLGLAIARGIAEQHGGTLTVEDSERGARFVARLPLRAAEEAGRRPLP